MRVGLFFGSFNPIHIGHLIIANHFVEFTEIEEVWFVISPQNPLKDKNDLLDIKERVNFVGIAIAGESHFKLCKEELELPQPSYTIHTLHSLKTKFPEHQFTLLMGSDNLESIDKWQDYRQVLEFGLFIYKRPGYEAINYHDNDHVKFFDFPLLDISATYIRSCLKSGKSVKYLLPMDVWRVIKENGFYK